MPRTYTVIALAALILILPPLAGCIRGEVSRETNAEFVEQTTERDALERKIEQKEEALKVLLLEPRTPANAPIVDDLLKEYRALLDEEEALRKRETATLQKAGDEEVQPIKGPVTGNMLWDTLIIAGGGLAANGMRKYLQSDRYREHMNNALKYAIKWQFLKAAEAAAKAGGVKHTTEDPDQLVRNAAHLAREQGNIDKALNIEHALQFPAIDRRMAELDARLQEIEEVRRKAVEMGDEASELKAIQEKSRLRAEFLEHKQLQTT